MVLRWYSLPAFNCISRDFTRPSLLRMRYTVDSDTAKPRLSVVHAANWRLLSSGISLAASRTDRSS